MGQLQSWYAGKPGFVHLSHLATPLDPSWQILQFPIDQSRLQIVEPGVKAEMQQFSGGSVFPQVPQLAQTVRNLSVICNNDPPVTEGTQHFEGVQAEAPCQSE